MHSLFWFEFWQCGPIWFVNIHEPNQNLAMANQGKVQQEKADVWIVVNAKSESAKTSKTVKMHLDCYRADFHHLNYKYDLGSKCH